MAEKKAVAKTATKKTTAVGKAVKAVKDGVKKAVAPRKKKSAIPEAVKAEVAVAEVKAPKAKTGRKFGGEY